MFEHDGDQGDATTASVTQDEALGDPQTYANAMKRSNAAEWNAACEKERRSFEEMGVYEVVSRPRDRNVIGSKWVFHTKRQPDGEIQKYKARVVAQGYTQVEDIDYDETFAPVAKLSSLRTILALAAEHDLELHHMDVESAYLNGKLKEEIYMDPPPGFDIPDGMALRLLTAVYGTKQGDRTWYKEIRSKLKAMGYMRTEADHAVFARIREGKISIIALHVDDSIMASNDPKALELDKDTLKQHYQMTDLGELTWILGMHVTRDRDKGWIALSQEKYIDEILERFGKANAYPISTPSLAKEHLRRLDSPEVDAKTYQRAIGALMHPMLATRPDIAYAVAALGRHTVNPGEDHQRALDRVFQYLCVTKDWQLVFQRGSSDGTALVGYADADWANDVNDRKSTSGYVFMLGGGAISWSSEKQTTVALSNNEAEYIAGTHAARELVWLRQLLNDLGHGTDSPTVLHMDNLSAIAIAQNPTCSDSTKHIEVKHHYLRKKVEDEVIDPRYKPTGEQLADVLTKGLAKEKHEGLTRAMGLRHLE
jgi:hypothetical protein